MRTEVIKLNSDKPDISKIKMAAQLLETGRLVAFPTETVYGIACKADLKLLNKVDEIKHRKPQKHYTLHIPDKNELKKYVPTIRLKEKKLIEKLWPGPLTIVFQLNNADMKKIQDSLEKPVFESLYKNNSIGIRCPDNVIAAGLLKQTKSAVIGTSANSTDEQPATEAQEVLKRFEGKIALLLDGGVCKYRKNSTVVKIGNKTPKILRPGVYSAADLEKMSIIRFLFVCSGNTCRSPMAEAMFRKYLSKKLHLKVDELEKTGYKLSSAGTLGTVGSPATAEAIAACAAKGLDIKYHTSNALSVKLIEESDFIFVMSRRHKNQITGACSLAAKKCLLLAEDTDIPDPIGQPAAFYQNCAELIEKAVKKRIGELII